MTRHVFFAVVALVFFPYFLFAQEEAELPATEQLLNISPLALGEIAVFKAIVIIPGSAPFGVARSLRSGEYLRVIDNELSVLRLMVPGTWVVLTDHGVVPLGPPRSGRERECASVTYAASTEER